MIWLVVAERFVVTGTAAFSFGASLATVACKAAACEPPGYRRHDLGLFFTVGFAVGR
jgi:hypothetical protein